MTELAKLAIEDGQSVRPFINYFSQTFQDLKGKTFSFSGEVYETDVEFINALSEVLEIWGRIISEQSKPIAELN